MRYTTGRLNFRGVIVICAALLIVASLPLMARARANGVSIKVVNSSSRTIRNLYLAHVNADDWGDNQLANGSTIAAGDTFTIANLTWDQDQAKIVAEDQEGCFLIGVVAVAEGSTWTITNTTPADCGNNGS